MLKQKDVLVRAIHAVYPHHREKIERLKRDGRQLWNTPDFIWERLLCSFSTMGNSRGFRLMTEPSLHDRVIYRNIACLGPDDRFRVLHDTLAAAPVRMAKRKATWLCANFERIHGDGGPEKVKAALCSCDGRDAKIAFLDAFTGIGDKYARNIMMDVYHPEFRDSIAYDERLKKVAKALGMEFKNRYEDAERFFLDAAQASGLNGWELDRLLYHATDDVLQRIKAA